MSETSITLTLDDTTAEAYQAATPEEQQKIQLLVRLLLREFTAASPQALRALMDDIGAKASDRGMTPKILGELLQDDDEIHH